MGMNTPTRIRVQRHRGHPPMFTMWPMEWWVVTYSDVMRTPIALVPNLADAQVIARIAAIGTDPRFFGGTSQQPPSLGSTRVPLPEVSAP